MSKHTDYNRHHGAKKAARTRARNKYSGGVTYQRIIITAGTKIKAPILSNVGGDPFAQMELAKRKQHLTTLAIEALIAAAQGNMPSFNASYSEFTDYKNGLSDERGCCVKCHQYMALHFDGVCAGDYNLEGRSKQYPFGQLGFSSNHLYYRG